MWCEAIPNQIKGSNHSMNIPLLLHVFAVVQLNTCTYCFIQMMYCFCNYVHTLLSMPWRMLWRCVMFAEIKHLYIIVVKMYCHCAAMVTFNTAESFCCVSFSHERLPYYTHGVLWLRNRSTAHLLNELDCIKCLLAVGQINRNETLDLCWLLRGNLIFS